jgi:hypothetical protein
MAKSKSGGKIQSLCIIFHAFGSLQIKHLIALQNMTQPFFNLLLKGKYWAELKNGASNKKALTILLEKAQGHTKPFNPIQKSQLARHAQQHYSS